jgi:monolysocardiolipin acyltransferase
MPEGRRPPWKYFPRPSAPLSVTFGAPLSPSVVRATISSASESVSVSGTQMAPRHGEGGKEQNSSIGRHVNVDVDGGGAEVEVRVRIALTELLQRAVEVLGRQVSGDLLTGLPHH